MMSDIPLKENVVQDVLYQWCLKVKHEMVVPNCGTVWYSESDLASMTKSGIGHEFEIKVTRSDWLSEHRKVNGTDRCSKLYRANQLRNAKAIAELVVEGSTMRCDKGMYHDRPGPNYFWIVAPPGVVKEEEIPDYAGYLEVVPDKRGTHGYDIKKVKRAPMLHRKKQFMKQRMALARGLSLRYWNVRQAAQQLS